jgi:CRP/FNR family transcriptional regulator, dissimilatory nitrate respiration regulator
LIRIKRCRQHVPVPSDIDAILAHTKWLAGLSPESLQLLATEARLVRFAKREVVFTQGSDCPGVYCVGSGLVRVYKLAPTGKEHVLHFAQPGETFGEIAAVGNFPAPAHAEAAEDTVCVLLPAARFRELVAAHHQLCRELLGGLAQWVRRLVGLMEDLVLRDAGAASRATSLPPARAVRGTSSSRC